jgi:hypothetical protein
MSLPYAGSAFRRADALTRTRPRRQAFSALPSTLAVVLRGQPEPRVRGMRKFLLAAGGAAILLGGALGVTYAQSATPQAAAPGSAKQHRQAIISDAAAQLGVSADQLQQALAQARKNLSTKPKLASVIAHLRADELQVAANTLGLADAKALRSELAGTTLTAVAQQHNVPVATLAGAIKADVDAKIQAAVNSGQITAARAAKLTQKADAKVDALMTRQFKA